MQKIKFFLMKLFLSLGHFFKQLEDTSQKAIAKAVELVNVVKTWEGSHEELINFITSLIPGSLDNIIVDKIRNVLEKVGSVTTLTGDERKLFYHNLAIQFSLVIGDGKLSFNDVVYLVQWYYDNHKTVTPPVALLDDNAVILKTIADTHAQAAAVEAAPVKSNEELHAEALARIAEAHKENV